MKKIKITRNLALLITVTLLLTLGAQNLTKGEIPTSTISDQVICDADKSNWYYTDLEHISTGLSGHSYNPDMVVDSFGNIHIVWVDFTDYFGSGTDGAILYKYFDVMTETWSISYFISDECDAASLYPAITIDLQDNLHLVWEDTSDYGDSGTDKDIMYRFRDSTTQIWDTTEVVSTESTSTSYDADVIVDYEGNVSVVWRDTTDYEFAGTDSDIFFKQRLSATDSWTTTQVVSTVSTVASDDVVLDVDSLGNVHVFWSDATDYLSAGTDWDVFYAIYYPNIDFWSTTYVVTRYGNGLSKCGSLKIDDEDNIHFSWEETEDFLGSGAGEYNIFYMKFIDSLGIWGTINVVSQETTGTSFASDTGTTLEIDSEDNVHIIWHDGQYGVSSWNVVYRTLNKDSNVWSNVELISMESADQSTEPVLALDQADNVYFAWKEAGDLQGSGTDNDIFFRAFAGAPQAPFIEDIVPNPTESSSVTILWRAVPGAVSYTVYRSDFYIYDVDGLAPHDTTGSSYYIDSLSSEDVHYYVVVAENRFGESIPSNCVFVDYKLPTLFENLLSIGVTLSISILAAVIIIRKRKQK